jgi:hypothetical protein
MPRTIATNTTVVRDELVAFIRPRHHVVLTTTRDDGSIQASPVTAGVDPQGRVVVSSYPDRANQGKCLLRLRIDAWGPISTGGFPARLAD